MSYTKITDFAAKDALASGNPAKIITGTGIDNEFNAIQVADALNLKRDGTTTASADIPMGSHKFTGLAAGTANTDSLTLGQAQNQGFLTLSSVAGTNTISGSLTPAITAYAAGQKFNFIAAGANTGATTLNINSLGAKDVTKMGTTALVSGDIPSGAVVEVEYDGTRFQLCNLVAQRAANADAATTATTATSATSATTATNIAGGGAGQIPYQSATGTTAMLAAGAATQVLIGGASAPAWRTSRVISQVVSTTTGAFSSGGTAIPLDNTIPQNTEGDQYMSLAITPVSATSTLVIEVTGHFANAADPLFTMALFQDTTANAIAATSSPNVANTNTTQLKLLHVMTSGTTSATTFKIRAGSSTANTTYFNGFGGAAALGGVLNSGITITEYLP